MGHKYYSIVRKEDFINDCNNLLNDDLNYQSYSSRIESMVKENEVNNLAVELSLSPNVVLSIITCYFHGASGTSVQQDRSLLNFDDNIAYVHQEANKVSGNENVMIMVMAPKMLQFAFGVLQHLYYFIIVDRVSIVNTVMQLEFFH